MNDARLSRVTAAYDYFGDGDPEIWISERLSKEVQNGTIQDFKVLSVTAGRMGLQHIHFSYKIAIDLEKEWPVIFKEILDYTNAVVSDTDVHVFDIVPIPGQN